MRPARSALVVCAVAALTHSAAAAPFAEAFGPTQLDALLAKNPASQKPVGDVAELVRALPDQLRQNFTFVYKSRSPFASAITPALPRVILFSDDASFIATFIGDAKAPGHDIIEMLIFDEETARFQPLVRVLPAAAREGVHLDATGCAGCHGADVRPIYDSYPVWPGFYGSAQDSFPKSLPASQREYASYVSFLRGAARRGVYASLRWIEGSRVSPYLPPEQFGDEETSADSDTLRYQPNTRLGMALGDLNRKRIFRKISAAPDFIAHERELLGSLLDCRAGDEKRHDAAIATALARENQARLVRLGADPHGKTPLRFSMQELRQVHNLTILDRAARSLGVDRDDWSMAMERGSLSFYDGILGGNVGERSYYLKEELVLEVLRDLASREPQFEPMFQERVSFAVLGYPFGHKPDLVRAQASCAFLR